MGDRIAIMQVGGVLAQYDTPGNILADPANDFVADFVGHDRVLKRLSLLRVSEAELEPVNGSDGLPRLNEGASLRDALSDLIGSGSEKGLVVADGGESRGVLTIGAIRGLSHRAETAGRG
jgi:osmoprotectant transport system ATP-binding protein